MTNGKSVHATDAPWQRRYKVALFRGFSMVT